MIQKVSPSRQSQTGVARGCPVRRPIVSRSASPGGGVRSLNASLSSGFIRDFCSRSMMRSLILTLLLASDRRACLSARFEECCLLLADRGRRDAAIEQLAHDAVPVGGRLELSHDADHERFQPTRDDRLGGYAEMLLQFPVARSGRAARDQ